MFPFNQARHFHHGRQGRIPSLIVLHDMEAPFGTKTAENVANWFASVNAPQASTHFNVDADSIVQSLSVNDTAWAAPGMNSCGIHIEHAGYARDRREKWLDEETMLNFSACLTAELIAAYNRFGIIFPIRRVTGDELVACTRTRGAVGPRGLCGHVDGTMALNGGKGHTDPGDGFPWDLYLLKVAWWLPHIRTFDFR